MRSLAEGRLIPRLTQAGCARVHSHRLVAPELQGISVPALSIATNDANPAADPYVPVPRQCSCTLIPRFGSLLRLFVSLLAHFDSQHSSIRSTIRFTAQFDSLLAQLDSLLFASSFRLTASTKPRFDSISAQCLLACVASYKLHSSHPCSPLVSGSHSTPRSNATTTHNQKVHLQL